MLASIPAGHHICAPMLLRQSFHLQVPAEQVLVIADDLDLPLGKVRLRQKGGHGGHNGLQSISQHMQGADFARLKIGEYHLYCRVKGQHVGQSMQAGCMGQHKPCADSASLSNGEWQLLCLVRGLRACVQAARQKAAT